MAAPVRILGIAGSLRKQSYNRAALRAAQQMVPDGATLEIFDLDGIPLYNQDLNDTPPETVRDLKAKVRAADAILFVTPEYNFSIPGVLKNAIDWASRANGENAWAGKPVAVMGVSTGLLGSSRAQYHLRQVFVFLDMHPVNKPEVMIAKAAEKFDANLQLTDPQARDLVAKLLKALVDWTRRLSAGVSD
ncbi:MAG: NAD(P)H-dependent oxidoreductase [Gemmatimonadales bacterium]|jgi:chromate reductase